MLTPRSHHWSTENFSAKWNDKVRLRYGIAPQESVLIHGPNHALYPLSLFAVLAPGVTTVIVPSYLRENMAYEAQKMKARIAIIHNSLLETVESILKDEDVQIISSMPISQDRIVTSSKEEKDQHNECKSDIWTCLKQIVRTNLKLKPNLKTRIWFEDLTTREKIFYGELLEKAEGLAVKIYQYFGVKLEDGVLIHSLNHALYPVAMFAVLALGATGVITPWYLEQEIAHEAMQMKIRVAIVHNELLKNVQPILDSINVEIIPLEPCDGFSTSIRELVELELPTLQEEIDDLNESRKAINLEKHCPLMFYSSGTTGKPKPILHTHRSIFTWAYTTLPVLENDICVSTFQFCHVAANIFFVSTISNSGQLRHFSDYEAKQDLVKSLLESRATCMLSFPKDLIFLGKYAGKEGTLAIPSIRKIGFGGAPTPVSVMEQLQPILPNLTEPICLYGSTEVGITTSSQDVDTRTGSVGKVMLGCELKVVDLETGAALGANQKGEMYLKTLGMFRKYREPESANSEAFTDDGWFKTGDFGYYDEEEYIYVCNRIADIIRVRKAEGSTSYVSPSIIEDGIYALPQVKHVAVVGEDVEGGAQLPVAFVIKQEGMEISEQEILDLVKNNFKDEPEMHLHRVVFVEDLLMSSAGKVYRLAIRKQYNLTKTKTII
ncbi:unnamed protein product [Cyprideis torosa]|uniref:Uncharacterized protein n=1 Tax=Cyprideis torosa TaxID=163714 RepID=A0A7R8W8Z9_9CRUS|nr:unnamed protein product [Cyprideis torosa]CAG0888040.1 unnamed protein product [Cyprideis torosa]